MEFSSNNTGLIVKGLFWLTECSQGAVVIIRDITHAISFSK